MSRTEVASSAPTIADFDTYYRAVASRDARFDGRFFTGVTTTGIYCRPICPARTPKPENVRFFRVAAAAEAAGFRTCRRCRPDKVPGSPDWNVRADLAGRALRLIADGACDTADGSQASGVSALARQLSVSERHLHRTLIAELGVGPLTLARSRRAQTARLLLESTALPVSDVAFAAGYGSIRQFNDSVREAFGATPSELRQRFGSGAGPAELAGSAVDGDGALTLRLAYRAPLDIADLFRWLGARAIPGVDELVVVGADAPAGPVAAGGATGSGRGMRGAPDLDGLSTGATSSRSGVRGALDLDALSGRAAEQLYRRALRLPHGTGIVELRDDGSAIHARLTVADLRDVAVAVRRCRDLLDLDADPAQVGAVLAADPTLAPLVAARPGMRVPGCVDGFEIAVRAILGQQVSVAGARTLAKRVVERFRAVELAAEAALVPEAALADHFVDNPVADAATPTRLAPFPAAATLADGDFDGLGITGARIASIRALAAAVAAGEISLDRGADRAETRARLLALPGIGPWTADYIALRAFGDPDAFPVGDLVLRRQAAALGLPEKERELLDHAERWRPWRAYAALHLWAAASDAAERKPADLPTGAGR